MLFYQWLTTIASDRGSENALVSGPIAATKFAPESRRRLQGTMLNCNLYKRAPLPAFREAGALSVHFTATVGGDPHGSVRTSDYFAALAQSLGKTLRLGPTDRLLCAVPLHHSYGFDFGLSPSMAFGATLYLEDEISARRISKLLRDLSVDLFPSTPALYGALVRVPTLKPLKLANARYLSSESPLPAAIAEGFYGRFGVRPLSVYHSTQAGPVAIDSTGKDPESVGRAFDGVEIRVTPSSGVKSTAGLAGSLWVRSRALSNLSVPKMRLPSRGGDVD